MANHTAARGEGRSIWTIERPMVMEGKSTHHRHQNRRIPDQEQLAAKRHRDEMDRLEREHQQAKKERDAEYKRLSKMIGDIGEKFGSFTEGMAFPSMQKVLRERFGMQVIMAGVCSKIGGRSLELDVLASSPHKDEIYVVEVKSHLKKRGLRHMLRKLRKFPEFFPDHKDKKLFGILAAVKASEEMQKCVIRRGLFFARVSDETFQVQVPEKFRPRCFENG